eukprot:NODE_510_length_6666_cov_0.619918.p7 type:complete len:111 gc:universal NODE_510_length_6666_cov_0.619918:6043-5711(-)
MMFNNPFDSLNNTRIAATSFSAKNFNTYNFCEFCDTVSFTSYSATYMSTMSISIYIVLIFSKIHGTCCSSLKFRVVCIATGIYHISSDVSTSVFWVVISVRLYDCRMTYS